jgi:hypothetical protein
VFSLKIEGMRLFICRTEGRLSAALAALQEGLGKCGGGEATGSALEALRRELEDAQRKATDALSEEAGRYSLKSLIIATETG